MEKTIAGLRGLLLTLAFLCLGLPGYSQHSGVRERVAEIYNAEIGVREKTGRNDGERVEAYLKSTGLKKGYAWCGAFVNWVYREAGVSPRATYGAQARAWFPAERLIDKHAARRGDLFSLWYNSLGRIGHVGFIDEAGDNVFITVEGNTNEAGAREGQGVYRKRRPKRTVHSVARWID